MKRIKRFSLIISLLILVFTAGGCEFITDRGNPNDPKSSNYMDFDDQTPPVPGSSGTITFTGISANSLSINWTEASDYGTAKSNLQYRVYYSESEEDVNSLEDCLALTPVGSMVGGSSEISATTLNASVSGLATSSTYYFNVVVRDEALNEACYKVGTVTTTATPDDAAPTVSIYSFYTSAGDPSQNAVILNWTMGSDNITVQNALQYAVYRSGSNNIDNLTGIDSNGTLVLNYTSNISSYTVTGLTAGTQYYFNIVVRDASGNRTVYYMRNRTTAAAVIPTVTTTEVTPTGSVMGCNNAMSGGEVTFNGGEALTSRGICWTTSGTPDIGDSIASQGTATGSFTCNLYPLLPGTTYFVRAYATNSVGTGYGSTVTCITGSTLQVGDTGPGGGRIFYRGTVNRVTVCMEVLIPTHEVDLEWDASTKPVLISGADGTAIGTGNQNTTDIVTALGSTGTAAYACYNLNTGGEDDWFLPSSLELAAIYTNLHRKGIGSFSGAYWSSTEYSKSDSYIINFTTGKALSASKTSSYNVRPIRSFKP